MSPATQSPKAVVMVRPHHFNINEETAGDNAFQQQQRDLSPPDLAARVYDEVTLAATLLRNQGVEVILFDDETAQSPDSVFPNNWFSTHGDGTVILYPMFSAARRHERRDDIIEALSQRFGVKRVLDYAPHEQEGRYLEGTGSVVIDHHHKVLFAARSLRTDEGLVQQLGKDLGCGVEVFDALDKQGCPVYHTNVLMSVASEFAILCSEMISAASDRQRVLERLHACNKTVIEISEHQVGHFLGNVLELQTTDGKKLAMSRTAYDVMTDSQRKSIEQFAGLIVLDVPNIERSGGSVRCMLAGLHL